MANSPKIGIFLPTGALNNFNSPSPTGAVDAYGNIYPTGSTLGSMIEMGDNEAANATKAVAGQNPMFGGAYQIVQVDSGATAANVKYGNAAYIKLDSGPTVGALPETAFQGMVVTDYSHLDASNLFAGVFLNSITPGNFGLIFVGAGRATIQVGTASGTPGVGNQVNSGDAGGGFTTNTGTTAPTYQTQGTAVTLPVASGTCVAYFPSIEYRLRP